MPPGRPLKITPELIKSIGDAVAAGLYKETASALKNISRETLHSWLKRGAVEKERLQQLRAKGERARPLKSEALYVELSDTIEKAIAGADLRDLAIVDGSAQGGRREVVTVTRTKSAPLMDHRTGKPIVRKDGTPILISETTTEVRESHAAPEWQAAAWKLERRNPREYGRRVIREPVGRDGDPVIPLAAIRAVLASTDELAREAWEELEDHGTVPIGSTAAALLNPPPDLPEGEPPADVESPTS